MLHIDTMNQAKHQVLVGFKQICITCGISFIRHQVFHMLTEMF